MSKIWFCRNCGYEVTSRGRCHACKARLSSSPLPELAPGDEDDEVGYRLGDWTDANRGRLIVRLIEANVVHRFDGDELVVDVEDEARTDDLVEEIASGADAEELAEADGELDDPDQDRVDEELLLQVETLLVAARRLRLDPTDMQADGDLALASGTVFIAESFYGADAETWAAIGRVTRRLLGALGAEEALEDDIALQAGILVKLLEPLVASDVDPSGSPPGPVATSALDGRPVAGVALDLAGEGAGVGGDAAAADDPDADTDDPDTDDPDTDDPAADEDPGRGESVYELPEWLPEQRAQLSLYLDAASIPHNWEGGDLVVAVTAEAEVEALFDRVDGVAGDEDDEERYRALEALFAAADRFVNDPDSRPKRMEVVRAVAEAEGPTPVGLDDAQWWSIRSRARLLADSIEHDASLEVVFGEATVLRDMLRVLV